MPIKNAVKAAGPISFIGLIALAVISGTFMGFIPSDMHLMYNTSTAVLVMVFAIIVAAVNIQKTEVVEALLSVIAISMGVASLAALLITSTLPFADVIGAIFVNLASMFLTIGTVTGFIVLARILKN